MRICVVGAGAIGGLLGAKLALAGEEVTLIARGPHLAAMREHGLTLVSPDGTEAVAANVRATSDMAEAGEQDVVFLTLKAHSVPAVAPAMRALYGPDTMVVTMQNGIPWWYFRKYGGPYEGTRIESVDPGGIVEANTEIDRVIASVVYPAAELAAPGVVRHIEGDRFSLGELDGAKTERIQTLAQTLIRAGLKAPVRPRIRAEIWVKLWGNLAFNPISALTRATLVDICQYPPTRDLARAMMTEAQTIAEKLDVKFPITIEQRINGAAEVGAHKTSMLQDIETGRPTEVDAIVGSVAELGRLTDTPTPAIDAIYASVKLLEKTLAPSLVGAVREPPSPTVSSPRPSVRGSRRWQRRAVREPPLRITPCPCSHDAGYSPHGTSGSSWRSSMRRMLLSCVLLASVSVLAANSSRSGERNSCSGRRHSNCRPARSRDRDCTRIRRPSQRIRRFRLYPLLVLPLIAIATV